MKDFNSTLFSELNSSNEFQNLIVDFYRLKNNIENVCDIDELFEMLGHNRISFSLRKPVEQIIDNYVKSLLGDMDLENLSISSSHSSCSINMAFDKVPSFEYKPNHWAGPSSGLVYIDFKKRQIVVYDSEHDYKKADELFQKKIQEEKEKLQDLKNHLVLMKQKRKSRAFILKEIRESIFFPILMKSSYLNVPKYILFHLSCYLSPARYKILLDAAEKMIKKQEERVQYQKKRVQEFENRSYINLHKELYDLQKQILERLKPLGFEIVTEPVKPIFS